MQPRRNDQRIGQQANPGAPPGAPARCRCGTCQTAASLGCGEASGGAVPSSRSSRCRASGAVASNNSTLSQRRLSRLAATSVVPALTSPGGVEHPPEPHELPYPDREQEAGQHDPQTADRRPPSAVTQPFGERPVPLGQYRQHASPPGHSSRAPTPWCPRPLPIRPKGRRAAISGEVTSAGRAGRWLSGCTASQGARPATAMCVTVTHLEEEPAPDSFQ
jgi:hypothetical protein